MDGIGELFPDLLGHQFPVGSPPAVYALFHVAYQQVLEITGIAVCDKRFEIIPLHPGGVLELVKQEMLEPDSQFLVDEGSVRTVYYPLENLVGIIQAEYILLFQEVPEFLGEIRSDTQVAGLLQEYLCGIVGLQAPVVYRYQPGNGGKQEILEGRIPWLVSLPEPRTEILRLVAEGFRKFGKRGTGVQGFEFAKDPGHEAPGSVGRGDSVLKEGILHGLGRGLDLCDICSDHLPEPCLHPGQVLLGIYRFFIDPVLFHDRTVFIRFQPFRHV